jgi:hypothetical protein
MGIFDGHAFDPDSPVYGGQPPGWLGANLLVPIGTSPGVGDQAAPPMMPAAPAQPQPTQAASAQPQAGASGRIGGGDDNPFAALFGGIGNLLSPLTSAIAPTGPGVGDRANAAVMNFLNGSALLPAIGGALTGLTAGQHTDPGSIMQAHQSAATQALVGAGLPPALAQAAVVNPALLRALAPQIMQSQLVAEARRRGLIK